MATVSVAEAKDKLSALLNAAEAGETVTITRHGRPVAELKAVTPKPRSQREWVDWISAQTADIPMSPVTGAELIRAMRDED
jgi:antitoxin (DNA-binding transcriptional repressor) of toxin-antitoxin stability system